MREHTIAQAAWAFVDERRDFGITDDDIRADVFGILTLVCALPAHYAVTIDDVRAAIEAELA